MPKENVIKVRMSDKDMEKLNSCKAALGTSISAIVRMGIDAVFNKINNDSERMIFLKNAMYKERVSRKDTVFQATYVWGYDEFIEVLAGALGESAVDESLRKIANGETVTAEGTYIQFFSLATPEDVEAARVENEKMNAELDAMEIPEVDAFMKKLFEQ